MIKISLIYIGIVVAIAALITGLPMLVWTDETADKVEQVANLPIARLIAPEAGRGAASGFGSAEAGGAETSAPVAPLPSGVEAATAALLQGLSEPPPAPAVAPVAAPVAEPAAPAAAASAAAAPAAVAEAPAATPPAASDSLAAAVAAAVAATAAPQPAPAAARPAPVGEDLTALIGATGTAQDELATMSGAALTGLRALRGEAAQGASLDELVARAAQAGAQDDYIKALQDEAKR
ncbi:MAG: hypothetical protein JNN06_06120 [Gemmobacter sp.]|uniref:hypothetical protein n=1 Tax=Gemmobacter sp. TaxID=1898957 RepID=UPI001A55D89A|nr:hypothetical protein [Gemmobacter sp.]MBL8561838.1 hypothetical protein [Gemmobacter sp.]